MKMASVKWRVTVLVTAASVLSATVSLGTAGAQASTTPLTSPVLDYATFLGGVDADDGLAITVDSRGDVYLAGRTASPDFPTTSGAYDVTLNGGVDAFVAKFSADGSTLLYSTLIGGAGLDDADSIVVDQSGNAYIRGVTRSTDFPTTQGSFDTSFNGGFDTYVTKISADGSTLVYSTFLGSTGFDSGSGIAIDRQGSAYVTGLTGSSDFPTTPGAFDTTFEGEGGPLPPPFGGDFDAYVTKLTPDGSDLAYSSFLGGSAFEAGLGIAVSPEGDAYVVGPTLSSDFPTTSSSFDSTLNGGADAFVTKLTRDGSALVYSALLGGSGFEDALGVAIGEGGNAYLTGGTESSDFPTTGGTTDRTFNGARDAWVAEVSADGSTLTYSTFVGGSEYESAHGIAVDPHGDVHIAGMTESADFPTTTGASDSSFNGAGDGFYTKLPLGGSSPAYSTFLGGAGVDDGADVAVGPTGEAYVGGSTASGDFPVTPDAFDETFNGNVDAFMAIIGSASENEASLSLRETVLSDGTRAQVVATFACPAGDVFRLGVVLTQGSASGRGHVRGTCSGGFQSSPVGITKDLGLRFSDGAGEACATLQTADPGGRTIKDTTVVCEQVTISAQSA